MGHEAARRFNDPALLGGLGLLVDPAHQPMTIRIDSQEHAVSRTSGEDVGARGDMAQVLDPARHHVAERWALDLAPLLGHAAAVRRVLDREGPEVLPVGDVVDGEQHGAGALLDQAHALLGTSICPRFEARSRSDPDTLSGEVSLNSWSSELARLVAMDPVDHIRAAHLVADHRQHPLQRL